MLLPLAAASPIYQYGDMQPQVTTSAGVVVGKVAQLQFAPTKTVHQYLGIPFALSPPDRFAPPTGLEPWTTPLNATEFKPAYDNLKSIFNDTPLAESEDCLYLNVFTPSTPAPSAGRPVMFWIHGGSLQFGSASLPLYDGSAIAANQNVIMVSTNYRTNLFGFPASPEIPTDRQNLGFLDQRKALQWVHQNIRAFGGDPSRITIFGESSGGYSVKQLIANPPEPLPFQAAIIQSQALGAEGSGKESWLKLVEELGCNSTTSQLQCVKSAPLDRIIPLLNRQALVFPPAIDNKTNIGNFGDAVIQYTAAPVPVLIGTNANEGTALTSVMPPSQRMIEYIFRNDTRSQKLARAAYPVNIPENQLKANILTDHEYTCTTSAIADTLANASYKVWRYYFTAAFPNTQPFPGAGAWHTSEIGLIFGTYPRDNRTTVQQSLLSRYMQRTWADFATDPEVGPGWAPVSGAEEDLQVIGSGESWGEPIASEVTDQICSVYSSAIYAQGF
ncbi:hypothetical protein ETB97_010554 [Aspergillus alliaceus]|uniref:Carboxylic ester hydrolase n=1 Tax=Petromyces alliaceus TaxID=209559 RepID=A0A8H6E1P8_PETAA|nr:hypothetical protein ETB97_010554 [Aspergillus burnettii]